MIVATKEVRQTKYCKAIMVYLDYVGHATNAEITDELRNQFPNLSDTTVHRATMRLAQRGELQMAPSDLKGSMRYDVNLEPHDHFMCRRCGLLRDVHIARHVVPVIEAELGDCSISGSLVVSGICKKCSKKEEKYG